MSLLNVKGVNQYYGGSHILRDVSLEAQQGKVTVLLGRNGVGKTTLFAWRAGRFRAGLDAAVLERLSYLLRIYAALEILLPVRERALAWLRKPNAAPLFGGGTALQRLLAGQVGDLMVVAQYLDAQRGGDFA